MIFVETQEFLGYLQLQWNKSFEPEGNALGNL